MSGTYFFRLRHTGAESFQRMKDKQAQHANKQGGRVLFFAMAEHSYEKWPLIVDVPMKHGDFPQLC